MPLDENDFQALCRIGEAIEAGNVDGADNIVTMLSSISSALHDDGDIPLNLNRIACALERLADKFAPIAPEA